MFRDAVTNIDDRDPHPDKGGGDTGTANVLPARKGQLTYSVSALFSVDLLPSWMFMCLDKFEVDSLKAGSVG